MKDCIKSNLLRNGKGLSHSRVYVEVKSSCYYLGTCTTEMSFHKLYASGLVMPILPQVAGYPAFSFLRLHFFDLFAPTPTTALLL